MNITSLFFAVCIGIASAIIGVTIKDLLANEPILNWWFRIGERIGKKVVNDREKERWFYRPIWGCSKCFSGQIALWAYIFIHIGIGRRQGCPNGSGAVCWYLLPGFSPFCLVLAICAAVIYSVLISSHINKTLNKDDN